MFKSRMALDYQVSAYTIQTKELSTVVNFSWTCANFWLITVYMYDMQIVFARPGDAKLPSYVAIA